MRRKTLVSYRRRWRQ